MAVVLGSPVMETCLSSRCPTLALAATLLISACGAAPVQPSAVDVPSVGPGKVAATRAPDKPTASVNRPPPDPFAALLAAAQKAASVRLEAGPEGGQKPVEVTTVASQTLAGQTTLKLMFTQDGQGVAQAPSLVVLGPDTLHLLDASLVDADPADLADALSAPSPWPRQAVPLRPQSRADGLYASVWRGPEEVVVCYGEGPPPDAPECEDVCFSEMCISSAAGVVELSGQWAPNADTFRRVGYENFRDRLTYMDRK